MQEIRGGSVARSIFSSDLHRNRATPYSVSPASRQRAERKRSSERKSPPSSTSSTQERRRQRRGLLEEAKLEGVVVNTEPDDEKQDTPAEEDGDEKMLNVDEEEGQASATSEEEKEQQPEEIKMVEEEDNEGRPQSPQREPEETEQQNEDQPPQLPDYDQEPEGGGGEEEQKVEIEGEEEKKDDDNRSIRSGLGGISTPVACSLHKSKYQDMIRNWPEKKPEPWCFFCDKKPSPVKTKQSPWQYIELQKKLKENIGKGKDDTVIEDCHKQYGKWFLKTQGQDFTPVAIAFHAWTHPCVDIDDILQMATVSLATEWMIMNGTTITQIDPNTRKVTLQKGALNEQMRFLKCCSLVKGMQKKQGK